MPVPQSMNRLWLTILKLQNLLFANFGNTKIIYMKKIIIKTFKELKYTFYGTLTNKVNILFIVLFGLSVFLYHYIIKAKYSDPMSDFIDPFFSTVTAALALVIWLRDSYHTWKNNLPKRLSFHFKLKEEYVLTCHKAFLSGESDIRAWSQQIAKQMCGNENLDFLPYIQLEKKDIEKDEDGLYTHYIATFYLSKLNTYLTQNNGYIVWWENNPKTPENKSVCFNSRPLIPASEIDAEAEFRSKAALS